jgi:alpha/beta superfamily hydrolase
VDEPADKSKAPRAVVVFAHPHPQQGGTMHTKAVFQGSKGLTRIGCVVLRFNFRGVGASAGTFDEGDGERADFAAALDYLHDRFPDAPLWAAGFSFGSWIALERVPSIRACRAHRHRAAAGTSWLLVHAHAGVRQAEVLHPGDSTLLCHQGRAFYAKLRAERARGDRRRIAFVRGQDA